MRLRIEGVGLAGRGYKVYLDGEERHDVKAVLLSLDTEGINSAAVTFYIDEAQVEAEADYEEDT